MNIYTVLFVSLTVAAYEKEHVRDSGKCKTLRYMIWCDIYDMIYNWYDIIYDMIWYDIFVNCN